MRKTMILSELKYLELFIFTRIWGCSRILKYKPILIYSISNFYMSMLMLAFRFSLDTFRVAIVTDTYFLQKAIPNFQD